MKKKLLSTFGVLLVFMIVAIVGLTSIYAVTIDSIGGTNTAINGTQGDWYLPGATLSSHVAGWRFSVYESDGVNASSLSKKGSSIDIWGGVQPTYGYTLSGGKRSHIEINNNFNSWWKGQDCLSTFGSQTTYDFINGKSNSPYFYNTSRLFSDSQITQTNVNNFVLENSAIILQKCMNNEWARSNQTKFTFIVAEPLFRYKNKVTSKYVYATVAELSVMLKTSTKTNSTSLSWNSRWSTGYLAGFWYTQNEYAGFPSGLSNSSLVAQFNGSHSNDPATTVSYSTGMGTYIYPRTKRITYNLNGGSGYFPDGVIEEEIGNLFPPHTIYSSTPTKDGYKFTGWALTSGTIKWGNSLISSGNFGSGSTIYPTTSITLTAQWEKTSRTITLCHYVQEDWATSSWGDWRNPEYQTIEVSDNFNDTKDWVNQYGKNIGYRVFRSDYTYEASTDVWFLHYSCLDFHRIVCWKLENNSWVNFNVQNISVLRGQTFGTAQAEEYQVTPPANYHYASCGDAGMQSDGYHQWHLHYVLDEYSLDLNWILDGTNENNWTDFATAKVYINGSLVGNDVGDWYETYPYGTTYKIVVTPANGKRSADGVTVKEGTITDNVDARFAINTIPISLDVEFIEPNASYKIGYDVVTSYNIKNNNSIDIKPKDKVKATFKVYANSSEIYSEIKEIVIPKSEKNIVYFKWNVPQNIQNRSVTMTLTLHSDEIFFKQILKTTNLQRKKILQMSFFQSHQIQFLKINQIHLSIKTQRHQLQKIV